MQLPNFTIPRCYQFSEKMIEAIKETIVEMKLEDKLLPNRNPDIAWFYCFFPALVAYLYLLAGYVNEKPLTGNVEIFSPSFHKIVPKNAVVEIITSGQIWTEGPIWIVDEACSCNYLLFTDTKVEQLRK